MPTTLVLFNNTHCISLGKGNVVVVLSLIILEYDVLFQKHWLPNATRYKKKDTGRKSLRIILVNTAFISPPSLSPPFFAVYLSPSLPSSLPPSHPLFLLPFFSPSLSPSLPPSLPTSIPKPPSHVLLPTTRTCTRGFLDDSYLEKVLTEQTFFRVA